MKLSVITAIAAGAALTHVSASPIRVMVFASEAHPTASPSFRFGHALGPHDAPKLNMVVPPSPEHTIKMKGGCRGSRFRQKTIEISNSIRKAFGFALIEDHSVPSVVAPSHVEEGRVRILPFIGTPNSFVEVKPVAGDKDGKMHIAHHYHKGDQVAFWQHLANKPFMHRLHVALMTLGPWEGRAIAFVLGCGIGVLLRMFWVLAIVTYRLIRGPRADAGEYTEVFFVEEIPEPVNVDAPPTYSYPDEKADKDKVQQNE